MAGVSTITQSFTLDSRRQMGCVTATDYGDLQTLMIDIMSLADDLTGKGGWEMSQLIIHPITMGANVKWFACLCFLFDKDTSIF